MTDDPDRELKHAITTLVRAAPDVGPTPTVVVERPRTSSNGRVAVVAAAFLLICGITAALYVAGARNDVPPASSVVAGPALLQPRSGSDTEISGQQFVDGSSSELSGAVIAPDGTVFGLAAITTQTLDNIPPTYEERTVSGLEAWSAEDGSAKSQIRRGIQVGCGTLSIISGQGPRWPATLESLVGSMRATSLGVEVNLPAGWQSLGAANDADSYNNTFTVTVEGTVYTLLARQAIDQPVGRFLSSPETNPIERSQNQQTVWHVAGGTTSGWNNVVAVKDATLIELSGEAPVEVLLAVLDRLEPVPVDQWISARMEADEDSEMASEESTQDECGQRHLIIAD